MLKKGVFVFWGVFLMGFSVIAQSLSVGPMVGGNVSRFVGPSNAQGLGGVHLGAFANYSVNDRFGINLKALYSGLGTAYSNNAEEVRLNYVQIPLTGVYYFGEKGSRFRPKVVAGGYVSPLVNAKNQNGTKLLSGDGSPAYQNLDFGGVVGVGFNYRVVAGMWLNLEGILLQGSNDVTKNGADFQNRSFQLHAGLSFPVGKK